MSQPSGRAFSHLTMMFCFAVTILGCCLALFLFVHELQSYLRPYTHTEVGPQSTCAAMVRVCNSPMTCRLCLFRADGSRHYPARKAANHIQHHVSIAAV